jgi:DHA1 family multidrug resistance protein-like MFS transporter
MAKVMQPVLAANGGINPDPELRLTLTPYAACAITVALFGFGWSGQYSSVHWIVPVFFSGLFSCGGIGNFQIIFAYLGGELCLD